MPPPSPHLFLLPGGGVKIPIVVGRKEGIEPTSNPGGGGELQGVLEAGERSLHLKKYDLAPHRGSRSGAPSGLAAYLPPEPPRRGYPVAI